MSLRIHLLIVAAIVQSGCAWMPLPWQPDPPETLASLRGQAVQVTPEQVTDRDASAEAAKQAYREFLAAAPESPLTALAMQRLADIELDTDESLLPGVQTGSDGAASGAGAAAELYQSLLARYPDRIGNDQIRYQLARALEHQGDTEGALRELSILVEQHPQSAYLGEAQFRRGEILFVQQEYAAAEQAYAAVLAGESEGRLYRQALYKDGWARFKLSRYDSALDAFTALLDDMLGGEGDSLSRGDAELVADTLRVISLSFIDLGGAEAIAPYFERLGKREYEDQVYAALAQLLLSKERYTDAADTYQRFVQRHPLHARAPWFQIQVGEVYHKAGFPDEVLANKRLFAQTYHLSADYWQVHEPDARPEVLAYLQQTLSDLARHYHAQAQAAKKAADKTAAYAEAANWYRAYLRDFPLTPEAPGMHFLLAETLFESAQFAAAVDAYEHTAYQYPAHDQSAEAGYAALLAYAEAAKSLNQAQASDWHRRGIDSALRFGKTFPSHEQAMPVLTRAAQDLFALRDYAATVDTALLVADNPGAAPALRRTAWTLAAHAQFELADFERAESAYQQALNLSPEQAQERAALYQRLAASIYKQGEAARAAGATEDAVQHFLRVPPDASQEIAAKAQFDAAAVLMDMQAWARAAEVMQAFRARYPNHALQPDITRNLALAYREQGQAGAAAGEFERIAAQSADPQLQREALSEAADLYLQAEQPQQAAAVFARYVERFPRPVEAAMEARAQLVAIHRELGDASGVVRWQQSLIEGDARAGGERTDRTRYLAAQARFELTEPLRAQYASTRLVIPLKTSLQRKKQLQQQVLAAYAAVADYQIAEFSTAATYHSGEVYRQFADALLESERPKGLNAEELEQYDILLEEQAYPFEDEAIVLHESNLKRLQSGVVDEWVRASLARLAELMPARYARAEQGEEGIDAIH